MLVPQKAASEKLPKDLLVIYKEKVLISPRCSNI